MRHHSTALFWTVLGVLASGCGHSLRFSVIDAETRKPLERVEVEWRRATAGFLKEIHFDNPSIAKPHGSGFVEVNGVSHNGTHTFDFTKPGYQPARYIFAHGEGWCLSPYKTNSFESNFVPATNPVVVPLHQVSSQNKGR